MYGQTAVSALSCLSLCALGVYHGSPAKVEYVII